MGSNAKPIKVVTGFNASPTSERRFEELYLSSYKRVYNYVSYRMANQQAAEDVVAEAYLLAARSFSKFDPARAKFSTWVTTIAINCMNSYYRKQRATVDLEQVPESAVATFGGQKDVEDRAVVHQLLACLDETEREIIALKYGEGYRNVEIAERLGMNASTVSTKVANALAKMRAASA